VPEMLTPVKINGVSEQPSATPEQPSAPGERPGRYPRTFGGLLAAMVATVVFVAAYVGFRAVTREQPDIAPDVDYLACVAYLQEADTTVVYPEGLPEGWTATSISFERGAPPRWRIGMVTADDEFVGVVQEEDDVEDLVDHYVDASAHQGEDASPGNTLGVTSWQTWSDAGGDHAFSARLDSGPLAGQSLLVYGSAPVQDQEAVLGMLTVAPAVSDATATDCDTDAL